MLTDEQKSTIRTTLDEVNRLVSRIAHAREDCNAAMRIEADIADDAIVMLIVRKAKDRMNAAANELATLLA